MESIDSTESAGGLAVVGYEDEDKSFIVRSSDGRLVRVSDTSAEGFPMWCARILVTAESKKWALVAARDATGFASSVIMSPAEAAIETVLSPDETPDHRFGVVLQIYCRTFEELRDQAIARISQCIMPCPTSAAYDLVSQADRVIRIGHILVESDLQKLDIEGRKVLSIPMKGDDFLVDERFGARKAVAGGTLILMSDNRSGGLQSAIRVVNSISQNSHGVVMPFPGGICRSGSKVGSRKYTLGASTNHPFCPRLKEIVSGSEVPDGVECVYEIVMNGLSIGTLVEAMTVGLRSAVNEPYLVKVSAANFGGRLGPYRIPLERILDSIVSVKKVSS